MKQLRNRTLFVLLFALLLAAGLVVFVVLYAMEGGDWAAFSANRHAYTNGKLSSGALYDRNGELLYDCESQTYGGDAASRRALLHVTGDREGNISTGALSLFATELLGYSPVFGTSGEGGTVTLTVDASLNRLACEALGGKAGVVALYNYKTGEILTLVSAPAYDPEDESEMEAVAAGDSAYAGAYLNRFFGATYTPGSTFKIVTTAAVLETLGEEYLQSFTFTCTGSLTVGESLVTCPSAHGEQTFGEALTNSCNCAFAELSLTLGGEALRSAAEEAGLLSSVEVDGVTTAAGSFDAAEDGSIALAWSGVGQSTNLVNPCAELVLMGCIAGDGEAAVPELLKSVTGTLGISTSPETETVSVGWSAETCETLQSLLRDVVTNHYADYYDFGDLPVCAKSGTAEVGDGTSHAWFVGFVESEEYPYAFVVVVEHGGGGLTVAGNVAAELLTAACGG